MFGKVLLAIDLSAVSFRILDVFYSMCPDPGTGVSLLHIVEDAANAESTGKYYKKNYSRLKGMAQDIVNAGYDHAEILWRLNSNVAAGIREAAVQQEADLLILASHGKGLWESAFRGSNTFEAVRAAEIPTLIVKDGYSCTNYLQRILLPTDFSRKSLAGLNLLRNLREHVGEVIFVHVVEDVRGEEELREQKGLAEDMLTELCNEAQDFGMNARYMVMEGGAASKEICRIAEEENCSLIFTGRTGAGPLKGLLMGSTAQNILLHSSRSLLVLPDDDTED